MRKRAVPLIPAHRTHCVCICIFTGYGKMVQRFLHFSLSTGIVDALQCAHRSDLKILIAALSQLCKKVSFVCPPVVLCYIHTS